MKLKRTKDFLKINENLDDNYTNHTDDEIEVMLKGEFHELAKEIKQKLIGDRNYRSITEDGIRNIIIDYIKRHKNILHDLSDIDYDYFMNNMYTIDFKQFHETNEKFFNRKTDVEKVDPYMFIKHLVAGLVHELHQDLQNEDNYKDYDEMDFVFDIMDHFKEINDPIPDTKTEFEDKGFYNKLNNLDKEYFMKNIYKK